MFVQKQKPESAFIEIHTSLCGCGAKKKKGVPLVVQETNTLQK